MDLLLSDHQYLFDTLLLAAAAPPKHIKGFCTFIEKSPMDFSSLFIQSLHELDAFTNAEDWLACWTISTSYV